MLDAQRLVGNRAATAMVQRKFQYKDVRRAIDLTPHVADIRGELEDAHQVGRDVLADFDRKARAPRKNYHFDGWAVEHQVDWKSILKEVLGIDVVAEEATEAALFGTQDAHNAYRGGRLEGFSLSGLYPVSAVGNVTAPRQVPRRGPGRFDYTVDDDARTLQLLRQVSSQLYFYLEKRTLLGKLEQEIQTMLAYDSLLIASNNPVTTQNLFDTLTTLRGRGGEHVAIYEILTSGHRVAGTGAALKQAISERHAMKLESLYQGIRQEAVRSPKVQVILDRLMDGPITTITKLDDPEQIQHMADSPGIYILVADSISGVSHAEQRLIELRDIAALYKADPTAWVAGKKRPCFGCWIHERLHANRPGMYRLVFQNQPGKAFINTHRTAAQEDKDEWATVLTDTSFNVHETAGLKGEVGPESDSEDENAETIPFYETGSELVSALGSGEIKGARRRGLKRHFADMGADFEGVRTYARKRQRTSVVEPAQEQMVEDQIDILQGGADDHPNPAFRSLYADQQRYERRT